MHNIVVSRLIKQLMAPVTENDWEFYSQWDVHIPPERGARRCPDLLIAPADPRSYDDNQVYGDSVLLAVEVVSASSVEDDYINKPREYAKAGVPLYLISDPLQMPCRVTLMSDPAPVDANDNACQYRHAIEVRPGEPLELPEPFGITLDTRALFR
jgi:Uma2 family endonuclease